MNVLVAVAAAVVFGVALVLLVGYFVKRRMDRWVDAMIAFPTALALLVIQQRPGWGELKKALKYGLDPKTLLLLYAVMLYKATIEGSGAAYALLSDMSTIGLPTLVILVALPFLLGLSTGLAVAFVGITFPLLVPFLAPGLELNSYAMLLAYTSGEIGILLSPIHLCLTLTAEYFKANLAKIYRYNICAGIRKW